MDVLGLPVRDRLICALDTPDVDEAKRIIEELDGVVSFFKIGITLHLSSGLDLVNFLLDGGKRVFLDLKYYDVPETVELAVRQAAKLGVTFLTIHGNSAIIQGAVRGRGDSALKLLGVTVLTSLDQDDLHEMGYPMALAGLVMARTQNALAHGADGVIASAQEVGYIKEATSGRLLVISPGIREADAPADDQKRKVSPGDAIAAGADFLVVGRPITASANRREAAERIVKQMEDGAARLQ
jgi:orotidine-5'-phosphate decarboxylase